MCVEIRMSANVIEALENVKTSKAFQQVEEESIYDSGQMEEEEEEKQMNLRSLYERTNDFRIGFC